MPSKEYNRYLAAIKAANDCEAYRAKELLRQIQADMISHYGLGDNDVDYLIRQFRYNVWCPRYSVQISHSCYCPDWNTG